MALLTALSVTLPIPFSASEAPAPRAWAYRSSKTAFTRGKAAASFKSDPTFPNQDDGSGRFLYENAFTTLVSSGGWQDMARTPFREYEEGVYLGYRYYETACEEGALSDFYNRDNGVLYPFGYPASRSGTGSPRRSPPGRTYTRPAAQSG